MLPLFVGSAAEPRRLSPATSVPSEHLSARAGLREITVTRCCQWYRYLVYNVQRCIVLYVTAEHALKHIVTFYTDVLEGSHITHIKNECADT